ncbi:serine arginine-rich splicing factor, partial [Ascosphaera pollenicola]
VGRGYGVWEGKVGVESRKGEIGEGWACDWRRLLHGERGDKEVQKEEKTKGNGDIEMGDANVDHTKSKEKSTREPATALEKGLPSDIYHLAPTTASSILSQHLLQPLSRGKKSPPSASPSIAGNALATVRISMLNNRGSPSACARIYHLPTTTPALRECWMQTLRDQYARLTSGKSSHGDDLDDVNMGAIHLPMPEEADLIGFVTTGNFNLRAGCGTGVGCVYVNRLVDGAVEKRQELVCAGTVPGMAREMFGRICIVRNAGNNAGRFGVWEII